VRAACLLPENAPLVSRIRSIVAAASIAALFLAAILGLARKSSAQSPIPGTQTAASSGKISFDVASVKQNQSSGPSSENLPWGGEDTPVPGGLYIGTNRPLATYIWFAYKLNIVQARALASELPKWADDERFDIQGRGPTNATIAQMRLMLQSLLEDRFQFKAHFETHQGRVYALVLVKPGVTGPKLRPHANNPPCLDSSAPGANPFSFAPDDFPAICAEPIAMSMSGVSSYSGRDVTIALMAQNLAIVPNISLDRPVADRTGLAGKFDFALKFSPEPADGAKPTPEDYQPAFLQALKDQLGLKLESTTGPITTFVVDHIEEPSPN
jgi:uncharacterized protein (TIGR03435 family)